MSFSFLEGHDRIPDDATSTSPSAVDLPAASEALPECDLKEFIERHLQSGSNELYAQALAHMERYLLTRVLQVTHGNQSKAAKILGITRGKIRDRIAAFGLKLDKDVRLAEELNESPSPEIQERDEAPRPQDESQ